MENNFITGATYTEGAHAFGMGYVARVAEVPLCVSALPLRRAGWNEADGVITFVESPSRQRIAPTVGEFLRAVTGGAAGADGLFFAPTASTEWKLEWIQTDIQIGPAAHAA